MGALSHLTASGWVRFATQNPEPLHEHALLLGILLVWLLWSVTP